MRARTFAYMHTARSMILHDDCVIEGAHLDKVLGEWATIHHGVLRAANLGRCNKLHGICNLLRILDRVDTVANALHTFVTDLHKMRRSQHGTRAHTRPGYRALTHLWLKLDRTCSRPCCGGAGRHGAATRWALKHGALTDVMMTNNDGSHVRQRCHETMMRLDALQACSPWNAFRDRTAVRVQEVIDFAKACEHPCGRCCRYSL